MLLAICNKDEEVLFTFETPVIPRKGELVNLSHRGTFRIAEIAYRIADENWIPNSKDLLMYVEVIIDFEKRIYEI